MTNQTRRMNMNPSPLCLLAALICGGSLLHAGEANEIRITCKPRFELKEDQRLHVADAEGNQRDAFRQSLILDDGTQQFTIGWATLPISRGPVTLDTSQSYTFTVKPGSEKDSRQATVLRIQKGDEVVYQFK